ncbi:hypothetical protein PV04_05344 [Phialophora macrospora]|uniref:Uncharacterized protein n=1 Tax=Phialophora macrospora TaxID=1851006 RepID=A0A0D2FMS8_9EURO|nr:hypothetical protein PV04_05344 [Phialophora macrospora]
MTSLPLTAGAKEPGVATDEISSGLLPVRSDHNDTLFDVLNISRSAHELQIGKPERRSLELDNLIEALCSGPPWKSLQGCRRHECIEQIHWDGAKILADPRLSPLYKEHFQPYMANCLEVLECWSYDGVTTVRRDHNFRLVRLDDNNQQDKPGEFEARLRSWLRRQGQYNALKPEESGALKGGIRLVMCDRPNAAARMTINRDAFEAIEAEFHLHEETLPAFLREAGSFLMQKVTGKNGETTKVQIVVKVAQHMEIANHLLSLTYDVARNWTDAFICGDGILFERLCDGGRWGLGRQQEQLVAPLISTPDLWTKPLLLPALILHVSERRMLRAFASIRKRGVEVEDRLGVAWVGWPRDGRKPSSWPLDIDVKWSTRELHSLLPRVQFMLDKSAWQASFARWLLEAGDKLAADPSLNKETASEELRGTVESVASGFEAMHEYFEIRRGRLQSHIDLLFHVVAQRDALTNLEVASSTKQDSISMSTFTFITAIFLPPTFVATLFSMSMFDWSNGDRSSGHVSDKFWIFWAIAVPLTATTILCWYLWYRHTYQEWQGKFGRHRLDKRAGHDAIGSDEGVTSKPKDKQHLLFKRRRDDSIGRRNPAASV